MDAKRSAVIRMLQDRLDALTGPHTIDGLASKARRVQEAHKNLERAEQDRDECEIEIAGLREAIDLLVGTTEPEPETVELTIPMRKHMPTLELIKDDGPARIVHERFTYPKQPCLLEKAEDGTTHQCDLPGYHPNSRHQCGECGKVFN